MTPSALLSETKYARLVADVRSLIAAGRGRAEIAAKNELVKTYWEIGKRIVEENLTEKAGYGDSVIEDLSEELDIDGRTLYNCMAFFKAYRVFPRGHNLSWAHYRTLLGVKDDSVRLRLEEKAGQEGWTRDQLTKAIRTESNTAGGKKPAKFKRPSDATYVYRAVVDKVIDGDTLLLRIDLGFQVWKEQRIRLADIDCPAMDEEKGRKACAFVREQMAKTDFVMVQTHKIDIYGRYVGHVFYSLSQETDKLKIFKEGRYLNQELVEKGLATFL
jgi:endonuclease YncB( thermonuclease family)